jgi:hypothetical protein
MLLAATHAPSVHAQTPASYASLLSGSVVSPICSSDNFASGHASGALSGTFAVAFDCRDGAITGGTWLIVILVDGPDGTPIEFGTIRGQVLTGTFEPDATGERISLRDVSLTITEGTGELAGVVAGTGSLEATSDLGGEPQFVGTIGLTF